MTSRRRACNIALMVLVICGCAAPAPSSAATPGPSWTTTDARACWNENSSWFFAVRGAVQALGSPRYSVDTRAIGVGELKAALVRVERSPTVYHSASEKERSLQPMRDWIVVADSPMTEDSWDTHRSNLGAAMAYLSAYARTPCDEIQAWVDANASS
jgi:hypothetical protein